MVGKLRDGSGVKALLSHVSGPIVAGGGADGAAVNGASIDRNGFEVLLLLVAYEAALSATKTLTVAVQLQDSADGTTWTDLGSTFAVTSDTLSASGEGLLQTEVDLTSTRRYVRAQVTPTLSNTATDTAELSSTVVLMGASTLPAQDAAEVEVLPA